MQLKMSLIVEENKSLKKQNQDLARQQTTIEKETVQQPVREIVVNSLPKENEDSNNIKQEIAEIKKLLEQSILIQNDKQTSNERTFEDNRSMTVTNNLDPMTSTQVQKGEYGFSSLNLQNHQQAPSSLFKHPITQFNELEVKWQNIVSRESEHVQMMKLSLQNEKLLLENRKLGIQKHEFEMKKELDSMNLINGHPLALKIKENLVQQLGIYKSEYSSWKDKCIKYSMKHKNLSILEKSYQFSKLSGQITGAADQYLQDLYNIYKEGIPEYQSRELAADFGHNQSADDGLSLDSHPIDIESESNQLDDVRSKSDKQSVNEFIGRMTAGNNDPPDYNYDNVNDIKQSLAHSYSRNSVGRSYTDASYERQDASKSNIQKYFANQSRFYDSMRREVATDLSQVESMVGVYRSSISNRPSGNY